MMEVKTDKQALCDLIPHAGSMCLLDKVVQWDENIIVCTTQSHLSPDNPLRNSFGLSTITLVEYGAQAMAVHGGLLSRAQGEQMQAGYLAALREVIYEPGNIHDITDELQVTATREYASSGSMIYFFSITAGKQTLLSGRATVIGIFN